MPGAARSTAALRRWARDTWHSLVAMTDPATGCRPTTSPSRWRPVTARGYTSPTNIGGYLWSAVVARELGIISRGECTARLVRTLTTLQRMEHHDAERHVLQLVRRGDRRGAAHLARQRRPRLPVRLQRRQRLARRRAAGRQQRRPRAPPRWPRRMFDRMRWDAFYNPGDDPGHPVRPGGLMHGGFFPFDHDRPGGVYQGTHIGGDPVWLTTHHYDTIVSETRITSYLGIITGQVPAKHYFAIVAHLPGDLRLAWHEMQPVGDDPHLPRHRGLRGRLHLPRHAHRPRLGRQHVRGAHARRLRAGGELGAAVVGASTTRCTCAPSASTASTRPATATGASRPASNPVGGYREYGVDVLGLNPDGLLLRPARSTDTTTSASATAAPATNPEPDLRRRRRHPARGVPGDDARAGEAYDQPGRIQDDLDAYGAGGFFDAVAVGSGKIARRYLSLDQAMVMGALGNVLGDNVIRAAFSTPRVERALRPVIGIEEFGAGLVAE